MGTEMNTVSENTSMDHGGLYFSDIDELYFSEEASI
jgi:hypothetical protein